MVFLSDKGSGSGDMTMRRCTSDTESQLKKICVDCGTCKTPLWRSGPAGPKSLCNACGIKSRKKRRPTSVCLSKEHKKPKMESAGCSDKNESEKDGIQNMVTRIKMVLKGETTSNDETDLLGCDFGEEERAAILLMALSYGILSS